MVDIYPRRNYGKQWSKEKRIYCVKLYYKLHSYTSVQENFSQDFEEPKPPSKSVIFGWIKKFEQEGTVKNLNSKSNDRLSHSGRKKICNDEVIDAVRLSVLNSPKRSTRKRCQLVGLSRITLRRVLHYDLKQYPVPVLSD